MSVQTACLGHPRMGAHRELKRALEAYWSRRLTADALETTARELRRRHWSTMKTCGVQSIPSNDFSLYDHVLDAAVAVGAIPSRYRAITDPLERYFAMARGVQDPAKGVDLPALEMTKWFDTNYHYIVPELEQAQRFALDATKLIAEIDEARSLSIETRPVLLGPVSFLLLSKMPPGVSSTTLELLPGLLVVYEQLFELLSRRGVRFIQLDEPCLVGDLSEAARAAYRSALPRLARHPARPKVVLTTYFGELAENLGLAVESGFEALHLDLVRAPKQLGAVLSVLPQTMALSVGVIDGRNVWRADLERAHGLVRAAVSALGPERVLVATSCSLLHVPVDLETEQRLDPELRSWLAFARQKLDELAVLARNAEQDTPGGADFESARQALARRAASPNTRRPLVRSRVAAVQETMLHRRSSYSERSVAQRARFALPPLPTTTIGSFPQTSDVRGARAAFRAGRLSQDEYDSFLRRETARCVQKQLEIGLDVLVHGEFERTDMVEYFGEQLRGFAFTENGWVQSYGSRCVKPPLLYGDVARWDPMTVSWSRYAQSLSPKPVKGMLTGPLTILQWSFVRDDQPRSETSMQIALALRDEVEELEAAGIGMIQVDEPALREGLPLRQRDRDDYLKWAVDAFRLATSGVRDDTQIHTHMCYSDFGDILEAISRMDADVISIETSRSKMELFADFGRFSYPAEVGPGVYDIHSPRVPSPDEMVELLRMAAKVLPVQRLWVNPDCGLKTRNWSEVEPALINMVEAAKRARLALAASVHPSGNAPAHNAEG